MNTTASAFAPMYGDVDWQPLIDAINGAGSIMLTTHCNPDGDGIGSQLALYDALTEMGKDVRMHNVDGVPRIYQFLDHADLVCRGEWSATESAADLIIALDCGSKARLGLSDAFFAGAALVNIDHHASNKLFGDMNIVDARYCATGAMIYDLLLALNAPMSKATATAIYSAVLTDTSSFRLSNATADVYRMAANLIDAGAEPWPVTVNIYESRPLAGLNIMTACLETLTVRDGGRSGWVYIDHEMYASTGADVEDTEGLIDYARSIDTVEVAVFIRCDEKREGCWKVSFRGKTFADVGSLAAELGGGGHKHAAGCLMRGTFDEVREKLEQAVSRLLA